MLEPVKVLLEQVGFLASQVWVCEFGLETLSVMTVTVFVGSKFQSQNGATYLVVAPAVTAADVIGCCPSVMKEELQSSHGE